MPAAVRLTFEFIEMSIITLCFVFCSTGVNMKWINTICLQLG